MRFTQNTQRRYVVVLALALCFWLVAFASHIHSQDDHPSSSTHAAACSYCLSLPGGAAPNADYRIELSNLAPAAVAEVVVALINRDVPSSYLSRGPPAR